MFVIDASVFNKLFLDEDDRHQAIALFAHCIENDIDLIAPSILPYEAVSAAIRFAVHLRRCFEFSLFSERRASGSSSHL